LKNINSFQNYKTPYKNTFPSRSKASVAVDESEYEYAFRDDYYYPERERIRLSKTPFVVFFVLLAMVICYSFLAYTKIPLISKWRYIYIDTAMATMHHQWLATAIMPVSEINTVLLENARLAEHQSELITSWDIPSIGTVSTVAADEMDSEADPELLESVNALRAEDSFYETFDELDRNSFEAYLAANPDFLANGYEHIYINTAAMRGGGTGTYTLQGDEILVVDADNGILIVRVKGSGYVGNVAIVKDASQVSLAPCSRLGVSGDYLEKIVSDNNAVLGINASGFYDAEGVGNGGRVCGLLISNGTLMSAERWSSWPVIGFGYDDRLYIGQGLDINTLRDAVEFGPIEIINGTDANNGYSLYGIQPRTSIGQSADGDVMFLTIDGRQPGYSLGTTVPECAAILLRYGAVQACNLDGGSSTIMYYMGQTISSPTLNRTDARPIPDAWIVSGTQK